MSTQDTAPPAGGTAPLDLDGLSRDHIDESRDQNGGQQELGDASASDPVPEADRPSHQQS